MVLSLLAFSMMKVSDMIVYDVGYHEPQAFKHPVLDLLRVILSNNCMDCGKAQKQDYRMCYICKHKTPCKTVDIYFFICIVLLNTSDPNVNTNSSAIMATGKYWAAYSQVYGIQNALFN